MIAKRGLFMALLALLALIGTTMPHQVWAQDVGSTADVCGLPGSNQVDTNFQNVMAAAGTRASQDITNAWNGMAKLNTAAMTCITTLQHLYQTLAAGVSGITDPLGIITSVLTGILGQLITSVCQSVASDLIQIKNSITSLLKICLPLPNFGIGFNLNLPNGCSGGLQIPLVSGTGANMAPPQYGMSWYK